MIPFWVPFHCGVGSQMSARYGPLTINSIFTARPILVVTLSVGSRIDIYVIASAKATNVAVPTLALLVRRVLTLHLKLSPIVPAKVMRLRSVVEAAAKTETAVLASANLVADPK